MSDHDHTDRTTPLTEDGLGDDDRPTEDGPGDDDRPTEDGPGDEDGMDEPTETELSATDSASATGATAPLPTAEEMAAATPDLAPGTDEGSDGGTVSAPAEATGVSAGAPTQEEPTRVLEFVLDGERYCLDIDSIEEIVEYTDVTRVPNTPAFVEGVVDLRGQITTILNPKVPLEMSDRTAGDHVVVFDPEALDDQGHVGWIVDGVRQVSTITDDEISDPPMDDDYVNGIVDRGEDEPFVVWTSPDLALETAE